MRKAEWKERSLPAERLHQLFEYKPETGELIWRYRDNDVGSPFNKLRAGKVAGCVRSGYVVICLSEIKGSVLAHRAIWAMLHGSWPEFDIDHFDKDSTNNRPENLRPATHGQNMCNRGMVGPIPYKGVGYRKNRDRYIARITIKGKTKRLGSFLDPVSAARAYDQAAIKIHGEFAATNVKLGLLEHEHA